MLYRIACFWVYGMCILLAVFIIEVSVVTTRSHGYVGNIKYILNFLTRIGRIVSWLVDTNMPRHLFLANTVTTISPPISTIKLLIPFFFRNLATMSLPYPLAIAEQSSMILGFCLMMRPLSKATFS